MSRKTMGTGRADFWAMARSFLHDWITRVNGMSQNTADAYRCSLECWLDYLRETKGLAGADVTFDAIGRESIKGWSRWMRDRGLADRTVALRLSAMRSFLAYCADEDATLTSLCHAAKTVKAPTPAKRPIEYLENDELAAVLAAWGGGDWRSRRNRAMLVALYESAARVGELCALSLGDVWLGKGPATFTIAHGKGNKPRTVPIGDRCAEHMRAYVAEFHGDGAGANAPLFYARHGGVPTHLSTDTVERVLKAAGDVARRTVPTVTKDLTCHVMRKTRAMSLYKEGVPLPTIMQLLGHESMSTTSSFYAFATQDMMARAIADSAPAVVSEETGWLTEERRQALYSLR